MSKRTGALVLGVLLWCAAVAMTPRELRAAMHRERIGARTVATMGIYLAAALLVLAGIAKSHPKTTSPPK